jgi:hypothetical protein
MLDMNRNCQDYQDALLDTARGVAVDGAAHEALVAHLHECGTCRVRMTREQALTDGLHRVAQSVSDAPPHEALEAQLLNAFSVLHPAPTVIATRRSLRRTWMAAAAAILILIGGLTWQRMDRADGGAPVSPPPNVAAASDFVPWPGAASLPAFESGQLVRTELPASVLPLLGLVPAGTVTDNKVLADVLIGQDGLARAVRLATF